MHFGFFFSNMATFFMQYGYLFLFQKALHLNKIEPPSFNTQVNFVPSLVETGQMVLEMIFKWCQCTFSIPLLLSPLALEKIFLFVKKRLLLKKLIKHPWILFIQECFVPSFVKIGPLALDNIFFLLSMYFCYFVIISFLCKKNLI